MHSQTIVTNIPLFPHPSRPDPDFDLLAKATREISSLSPERLCNFQRWRRHVQSFGDCNRDQERNSTSKLGTRMTLIEEPFRFPEVNVEPMFSIQFKNMQVALDIGFRVRQRHITIKG